MAGSWWRSQRQQEQLRRPLLFFPKKKRRQGWRQRQSQCYSRRADWRRRQDRWQQTMRGGGKLGKPTHLRRIMGRCATFFFARYEGVPRGHLNQRYERTDQVFSALPSRPTGDMSVDFLDMSAKGRAGCNAALSSLSLPRDLSSLAAPWMLMSRWMLPPEQTATPTGTHFSTFRMHWTEKQY